MTPASAASRRNLEGRYERLVSQLVGLFVGVADPVSRMSTVAALLHHKMPHFFWTGFYRLIDGELIVGPYQGPLACMALQRDTGVCWAAINRGEAILVPDVDAFPGHIACDARSRSEVVVLLRDRNGDLRGVLDVDSEKPDAFGEEDVAGLERISRLIYDGPSSAG